MASSLATLKVAVAADTSTFETGMEKVKGKLQGVAGIAGVLVAATGAAVVGFGIVTVNAFTASAKAAKEMSDRFGISAHQASQLTQSAALLNISSDTLNTGMTILTRTMGNMDLTISAGNKGAKLQTEIFKELKVKINDTHGAARPLNAVLADLADRFQKMPDGQQKTTIAMKLFGRSAGPELIPFLNQGSAGIAALTAKATALGAVLSNEDVKAAHDFALKTAELHVGITGITNTLARLFIPAAVFLVNVVNQDVLPALLRLSRWFVAEAKPRIDTFVSQVWNPFVAKFSELKGWVDQHWPEIKATISTALSDIGTIVGDVKQDFLDLGTAISGLAGDSASLHKMLGPLVESFKFLHEHTRLVAHAVTTVTLAYVGFVVANTLVSGGLIVTRGAMFLAAAAVAVYEFWVLRAEYAQLVFNAIMMAAPWVLVVVGIALVIAGIVWLVFHWKQVIMWAKLAWAIIQNVPIIGPFIQNAVESIGTLADVFRNVWDWCGKVIDKIGDFIGWLGKIKLPPPVQALVNLGGTIAGIIGKVAGSGIQVHAGGGYAAYTGLHWLEQGEQVLNRQQQGGGGSDLRETNALLRDLLRSVSSSSSGQSGVAAALYKAMSGSQMNRLRGMAGA